jgi:hypothetical protein
MKAGARRRGFGPVLVALLIALVLLGGGAAVYVYVQLAQPKPFYVVVHPLTGEDAVYVNGTKAAKPGQPYVLASRKPVALVLEAKPGFCSKPLFWGVEGEAEPSGVLNYTPTLTVRAWGNTTINLVSYVVSNTSVLIEANAPGAAARVNGSLHKLPVELKAACGAYIAVEPVAPEGWEALNGTATLRAPPEPLRLYLRFARRPRQPAGGEVEVIGFNGTVTRAKLGEWIPIEGQVFVALPEGWQRVRVEVEGEIAQSSAGIVTAVKPDRGGWYRPLIHFATSPRSAAFEIDAEALEEPGKHIRGALLENALVWVVYSSTDLYEVPFEPQPGWLYVAAFFGKGRFRVVLLPPVGARVEPYTVTIVARPSACNCTCALIAGRVYCSNATLKLDTVELAEPVLRPGCERYAPVLQGNYTPALSIRAGSAYLLVAAPANATGFESFIGLAALDRDVVIQLSYAYKRG